MLREISWMWEIQRKWLGRLASVDYLFSTVWRCAVNLINRRRILYWGVNNAQAPQEADAQHDSHSFEASEATTTREETR